MPYLKSKRNLIEVQSSPFSFSLQPLSCCQPQYNTASLGVYNSGGTGHQVQVRSWPELYIYRALFAVCLLRQWNGLFRHHDHLGCLRVWN